LQPRWNPGGEKIETTFDNANRRDVIKRDGSQLVDYDYVGGRVKTLTYETGDDVAATRLYDGVGRATRLTWAQTSNTLPDFSYVFDKAGNILTKKHEHRASNKDEAYNIDGLYRLTDARYDFRTLTHQFNYDDLGNQLTFTENAAAVGYQYNNANELTKQAATQVYYDKTGNLTKDAAAGTNLVTTPYQGSDDTVLGTTIHTGANGICSTTAAGNDTQTIPVNQGKANQTCITDNGDGLQTTKAGDDVLVGNTINTGANGICQTAVGDLNGTDDIQLDTLAPEREEWPDDLGVPPAPPYAAGWAYEQQADDAEPDDDTKFARNDWGDPGKNHKTIDKYDN